MSETDSTPSQETELLLRELLREIRKMKAGYTTLQQQNERLRQEIIEAKQVQTQDELPLGGGTTERLALRQQIMGMIEKIDKHLPGATS